MNLLTSGKIEFRWSGDDHFCFFLQELSKFHWVHKVCGYLVYFCDLKNCYLKYKIWIQLAFFHQHCQLPIQTQCQTGASIDFLWCSHCSVPAPTSWEMEDICLGLGLGDMLYVDVNAQETLCTQNRGIFNIYQFCVWLLFFGTVYVSLCHVSLAIQPSLMLTWSSMWLLLLSNSLHVW